ncbi:unnamed protein product [Amoebophrya sp. A25]|nr:unnamed protein product [Amoebophrya sp. A25]|eukprot:GSA25T00002042001.1
MRELTRAEEQGLRNAQELGKETEHPFYTKMTCVLRHPAPCQPRRESQVLVCMEANWRCRQREDSRQRVRQRSRLPL